MWGQNYMERTVGTELQGQNQKDRTTHLQGQNCRDRTTEGGRPRHHAMQVWLQMWLQLGMDTGQGLNFPSSQII